MKKELKKKKQNQNTMKDYIQLIILNQKVMQNKDIKIIWKII